MDLSLLQVMERESILEVLRRDKQMRAIEEDRIRWVISNSVNRCWDEIRFLGMLEGGRADCSYIDYVKAKIWFFWKQNLFQRCYLLQIWTVSSFILNIQTWVWYQKFILCRKIKKEPSSHTGTLNLVGFGVFFVLFFCSWHLILLNIVL